MSLSTYAEAGLFSLNSFRLVRSVPTLLVVLLASACPEPPPPPPPPADTTPPVSRATPAGGRFTSNLTVALSCDDEQGSGCAATYYTVDGSEPSTSSATYSTPIAISRDTTLKFFSVDSAGNREQVHTEVYDLESTPTDTQAPTTTASPVGGVYTSVQTVALSCADGAGSGCAATYYTTDGSTPTTSSARYTAALSIASNTTLKFFSVDNTGNQEQVRTESYTITLTTSAQIAAVRAAADGAISLPINLALVTYVKPLLGEDPAGFFLQAEPAGPAIFVAVEPTTLSPVPEEGDRVSLVATQKSTVSNQARITALAGFSRSSRGTPVGPLRVDVSDIDLPTALDSYESRLISITGSLTSDFTASGSGHVVATLATVGTPTGTHLSLRVPATLQEQLDLANGCVVAVGTPLWRHATTAQPSIWATADLSAVSCPAPRLISASATGPNTVAIRFDRRINPASVSPSGSQFTFTNGLQPLEATVVGREVHVTTTAQTIGTFYQVSAATTVADTYGTPLDSAATSATFIGY